MHFHQNSHGKVIHNHRTLSQYTGLCKVCVFLCICVSTTAWMCVRACVIWNSLQRSNLCSFFTEPNMDFCFWAQLEINQANLRQIHDSHYGNESRQLRILTFAYVRKHTQRGASILTLFDERDWVERSSFVMFREDFHFNQRQCCLPTGLFPHRACMEMCYCKNLCDGFLTSAQEDFSVCFENDRRATRGKET